MKTLSTLLLAATFAVSFNANADVVHGDPGMGDVFPMNKVTLQTQEVSTVADTGEKVWSVAFEEYVNPADFNTPGTQTNTLAGALQALDDNPPAAGVQSQSVFLWDETADEFQLQ